MLPPPIDLTGADVTALPVKHKPPPDGSLMLVPPPFSACIHFNTSFEICSTIEQIARRASWLINPLRHEPNDRAALIGSSLHGLGVVEMHGPPPVLVDHQPGERGDARDKRLAAHVDYGSVTVANCADVHGITPCWLPVPSWSAAQPQPELHEHVQHAEHDHRADCNIGCADPDPPPQCFDHAHTHATLSACDLLC